jgi:hypothetical protein
MAQPLYRIRPEGNRQNLFQRSSLTVDVSGNHLALTVVDKELNIVEYLDYFSFERVQHRLQLAQLDELLSNHPFASESFASTLIICHTEDAVLLPNELYRPAHRRKLLEWQSGDLTGYIDMDEMVEQADIRLLFAFPEPIFSLLRSRFPTARFCHAQAAALQAQMQKQMPEGYHISLSVYADLWICTAWCDGTFELIQSFDRTTADDLCYRLINVCRSLNWKPEITGLEIGGMIHRNAAELTLLKRFFSQITLSERPSGLLYDDGFFSHPAHFFSPLIQHTLCES